MENLQKFCPPCPAPIEHKHKRHHRKRLRSTRDLPCTPAVEADNSTYCAERLVDLSTICASNYEPKHSGSCSIKNNIANYSTTAITYQKLSNNKSSRSRSGANTTNYDSFNINRTSPMNLLPHCHNNNNNNIINNDNNTTNQTTDEEDISSSTCCSLTSITSSCSLDTSQSTTNVFKPYAELPPDIVRQFLLKSSETFLSGLNENQQPPPPQQQERQQQRFLVAGQISSKSASFSTTTVGIDALDLEDSITISNASAEAVEKEGNTPQLTYKDYSMRPKRQKKSSLAYKFLRYAAEDDCGRSHRAGITAERSSCITTASQCGAADTDIGEAGGCEGKDAVAAEGSKSHADVDDDPVRDACQYNLRLTHFHCMHDSCTSVCLSMRDAQRHANWHKTMTTISTKTTSAVTTKTVHLKSYQRYRAQDDCKASFCIYSGIQTAHFHCSRENCQFTFHNKSDMVKHRAQHNQRAKSLLSAFSVAPKQRPAASNASSAQQFDASVLYLQRLWQQQQHCVLLPILSSSSTATALLHAPAEESGSFVSSDTGAADLKASSAHPVQITSIDGFFNRKRGRPPKNRFVEVYKSTQETPQAIFTSFKLEKQQQQQQQQQQNQSYLVQSDANKNVTSAAQEEQQVEQQARQDILPAPPLIAMPLARSSATKDCNVSSRYHNNSNINNNNNIKNKNNNNYYNMQQMNELDCGIPACRARKTRPHLHCGKCRRQVSPFDLATHTCAPPHMALVQEPRAVPSIEENELEKVSVVRAAGTFYPENSGSNGGSAIKKSLPVTAKRALPQTSAFKRRLARARHEALAEDGDDVDNDVDDDDEKEVKPAADYKKVAEEHRRLTTTEELPQDLSVKALRKAAAAATAVQVVDDHATTTKALGAEAVTELRLPPHLLQIINFYQQQQQQFLLYGHAAPAVATPADHSASATPEPLTAAAGNASGVPFNMVAFFEKVAAAAAAASTAVQQPPPAPPLAPVCVANAAPKSNAAKRMRWQAADVAIAASTALNKLRDERDRIPAGYLKYRFNEDCGFTRCGYRQHQSHFHCNRRDCHYSFCDKTRFVQHTARHERLDTLMGDDFQQYRANMSCGYAHCPAAASTAATTTTAAKATSSEAVADMSAAKLRKSSHFHCLKCDFICADTNKVVAHRRLHSKLEYIRLAGFRKVASNECCQSLASTTQTSAQPAAATAATARGTAICAYSMRHTHYHCLRCDCSVLSRAQLSTHKHK